MPQMWHPPGGIYIAGWGYAVQTFDQHSYSYEIHIHPCYSRYSEDIIYLVDRHLRKLRPAIVKQPYYRRIPDWRKWEKEVIFMDPTRRAVVSMARQGFKDEYPAKDKSKCTMREVLNGYSLASSEPYRNRDQLIAMSLELHILQNIPHRNIITLLSVDYSQTWNRSMLFYELSVPLLYYIREHAFVGREDSIETFKNANIAKYITKCISRALSHLVHNGICLGGNVADAVFITYSGTPKLGSFLDAEFARDNYDYQYDVAALGGLYVALLNRRMPRDELYVITHGYRSRFFITAYDFTHDNLYGHDNAFYVRGLFAPGTENYTFVRRFLAGLYDYSNSTHELGLTNVPDLRAELRDLVRQNRPQFFSGPRVDPQTLPLVPPLEELQTWQTLNIRVRVLLTEIDDWHRRESEEYDRQRIITLNLDSTPQADFLALVKKCLDLKIPVFEIVNVDRNDSGYADDEKNQKVVTNYRSPFDAQDLLFIYQEIVTVYNRFVREADKPGIRAHQIHWTNFSSINTYRKLMVEMKGLDGQRLDEEFVPDWFW